jgi:RND family efflux transporter MFP subunit
VQPLQQVQIASQIEATVRTMSADVGHRVRKGQTLVELDCRLLRAELAEAEAELGRATAEASRAKRLVDAGLGEDRRLEMAASQEQIDRARVDRLRTQAEFCRLTSPFDGVVTARGAYPGDLARPGMSLLTVADVSRLRALIPLPERDAAPVRVGASVEVSVDAVGGNPVNAKVSRIWPTSDPTTHRTTIEIDLGAAWPSVKPGYMVRARIPTAQSGAALVMDRRALLPSKDGTTEVFAVDGGVVRRRRVRVGLESAALIEIRDGLKEGDRVVVRGAERLSDGSPVRVEELP